MQFGSKVFSMRLMETALPKKVFQNLQSAIVGTEKLDTANADIIAEVLKDWAIRAGATHYTHWFQPLTGGSAQKHDSFIKWNGKGGAIESFRGKELFCGEPDASSFPSGGLRKTHQARGYTMWDPASSPFLWSGGDGVTLCIPSLFFSWTGQALDHKIPLLRSDQKINKAAQRLLKLCDIPATRVFSTVGLEQEYFLIDRRFFNMRPDLLLAGRTVYGARPPKGQELEDHYFGPVKDRVMAFMREFEEEAIRLGIPVKTRHNEVAPSQFEVAPLFEPSAIACDHNLLLMELMRQTALDHDLACLMHEKPFANLNGSGKHSNWSLATDTGINLLDPRENSLLFLTLLTAILRAVHDHAGLMRASIASAGNDHRLGGSEAPPTILSVYLGTRLDTLIDSLIQGKPTPEELIRQIDLGLAHVPPHIADASDRNRTSFFAFTGNKFEFRAVGASAHSALPVAVINAIVADALDLILDEIADVVKDRKPSQEELFALALPILRKQLKASRAVIFSGNAYTKEWEMEAARRGLPNIVKSFHAFEQLTDKRSQRAFSSILSEEELHSRYEILVEGYVKTMEIEANLMVELFRTQVLPAALLDQKRRTQAIKNLVDLGVDVGGLTSAIKKYATALESALSAVDEIEKVQHQSVDFGWEIKGKTYAEILAPKMAVARTAVDRLEGLVDNTLWPLPKYREMLFVN
jgi:glutamine synthetase